MKRNSISQAIQSIFNPDNNNNNNNNIIQGKVISRPTIKNKEFAWSTIHKLDDSKEAMINSVDLKHAQMQLLAERAKVQDLQKTLKTITDEKFTNESNIINRLQQSQNALREQLSLVIASKMELCESTSAEMDRLRKYINILENQLYKIYEKNGKNIPDINQIIQTLYNNKNNINNNLSNNNSSILDEKKHNNYSNQLQLQQQQQQQQLNDDLNDDDDILNGGITKGGPNDNNPLNENNLNPNEMNPNPYNSINDDKPFPHNDISRIDIRTIKKGDGITFADPFAAVDLKYIGYKYKRNGDKWERFTSTKISDTVFETRLGNHENIIGLEQAVLTMTKGEVSRVWVPSRLGYGIHGAEPLILPNTDLIFELTLVEIRNDFQTNNAMENNSMNNSNNNNNNNNNTNNNNNNNVNIDINSTINNNDPNLLNHNNDNNIDNSHHNNNNPNVMQHTNIDFEQTQYDNNDIENDNINHNLSIQHNEEYEDEQNDNGLIEAFQDNTNYNNDEALLYNVIDNEDQNIDTFGGGQFQDL